MRDERTIIKYENLQSMLGDLNATDRGRYVLCDCPDCGRHEAFMYKNNPYSLHCNRTNNCGFQGKIEYDGAVGELEIPKGFTPVKTNIKVTGQQRNELDWMNKFINYYQRHVINTELDKGYRGISKENIKPYAVDLKSEEGMKFFFNRTKSLFKKDYAESSFMTERNIIFPLRDDNGRIETLSLRSTLNPNTEKKEIQVYADPRENGRDFLIDIPPESNHVVIGEAIIDSLSFKEIDPETGIIGLTGYRKINKLKDHIVKNKDLYKDKSFLIATDDDIAGDECRKKLNEFCDREGLQNYNFDYKGYAKDGNEFLQKNRLLFETEYFKQKRPFKELSRNKELAKVMER